MAWTREARVSGAVDRPEYGPGELTDTDKLYGLGIAEATDAIKRNANEIIPDRVIE